MSGLPRLSSLGRMTCPHCGRPETAVMTGWRMWPHNFGPTIAYTEMDRCSYPGDPPRIIAGTYRQECPGGTTDDVLRAALRLSQVSR